MLKRYDPREGKRLELLSPEGKLAKIPEGIPRLPDELARKAWEFMVRTRETDEWAVSLNRQGRLPTYPPNKGQEANSVAALLALRPDDWFVMAFREIGGMMVRGIPLEQQFLYWLGNEEGSRLDPETYHTTPISVPIGSQALHATGLAFADRYRGRDRVTLVYVGDGGTSEGEFYEGLNFAGVWRVPVIFYVQNNGWAISTPRSIQTAAATIAEKSFACGFPGIQIDGNDVFAVYAAVSLAAERGRRGEGPTLIEGVTYRLGAHTTADDPTRYRRDDDVAPWRERDPLLRLQRYLIAGKLLTEEEAEGVQARAREEVIAAFDRAEAVPAPTLDDGFRYMFHEMPPHLQKQLADRAAREGGNA